MLIKDEGQGCKLEFILDIFLVTIQPCPYWEQTHLIVPLS